MTMMLSPACTPPQPLPGRGGPRKLSEWAGADVPGPALHAGEVWRRCSFFISAFPVPEPAPSTLSCPRLSGMRKREGEREYHTVPATRGWKPRQREREREREKYYTYPAPTDEKYLGGLETLDAPKNRKREREGERKVGGSGSGGR